MMIENRGRDKDDDDRVIDCINVRGIAGDILAIPGSPTIKDLDNLLFKYDWTIVPENEVKEISVRGIAASIQAMGLPTFSSLADMLIKFGYSLVRIRPGN